MSVYYAICAASETQSFTPPCVVAVAFVPILSLNAFKLALNCVSSFTKLVNYFSSRGKTMLKHISGSEVFNQHDFNCHQKTKR